MQARQTQSNYNSRNSLDQKKEADKKKIAIIPKTEEKISMNEVNVVKKNDEDFVRNTNLNC